VRLHGLLRGRPQGGEGRWEAMMARWTAPLCSGDGRQAGLWYLAAGSRYTIHTVLRRLTARAGRPYDSAAGPSTAISAVERRTDLARCASGLATPARQ
jgi:hypothetical protein